MVSITTSFLSFISLSSGVSGLSRRYCRKKGRAPWFIRRPKGLNRGPILNLDPRVLLSPAGAALLGADDLRFTASILAHGFLLGRAFPRDSQWPLRLRSHSQQRDCSGFSPDSLQPKTVFICLYYATVSQGKSQLFCDGIPCKISDEPQLTGTEKPRIIYLY